MAARRARDLPAYLPYLPVSTQKPPPIQVAAGHQDQDILPPQVTAPPGFTHRNGKRQDSIITVFTSTNTVFKTSIITVTETGLGVATATVSTTQYQTQTSFFNARTTIRITTTVRMVNGQVIPVNNSNGGGGSSRLSTGAKAGIGIGVGAATLIFGLLLALFLRNRRKAREASNQELINNAVVAAMNANQQPSMTTTDYKAAPGHTYANHAPSQQLNNTASPQIYSPQQRYDPPIHLDGEPRRYTGSYLDQPEVIR